MEVIQHPFLLLCALMHFKGAYEGLSSAIEVAPTGHYSHSEGSLFNMYGKESSHSTTGISHEEYRGYSAFSLGAEAPSSLIK